MAFYDSFEDFISEFDALKKKSYNKDLFEVVDVENASLVEKIRHWAWCKSSNSDCEFDLSFLRNERLEAKIQELHKQCAKIGGVFLSYLYNNLYELEDCFTSSNERTNRWNLFETSSELVESLRAKLKERDKTIQRLTEKLNVTKNERTDDFRDLLRSILLDDF